MVLYIWIIYNFPFNLSFYFQEEEKKKKEKKLKLGMPDDQRFIDGDEVFILVHLLFLFVERFVTFSIILILLN